MKKIIKYMIACATPLLLSGMLQAQVNTADTVCKGENVCITTPAFRGTIQWQSSPDMTTWTNIPGATNDTSCFNVIADTYYRGAITENTCDILYTDTTFIMTHNYERSATFTFTGGIQTFTIPADVCDSIKVELWGAAGGNGDTGGGGSTGGTGGLGGYIIATYPAVAGTVLNIFVGGQGGVPAGGFNAGATGGSTNAGGGGGASDIRIGGTADTDRIIVAGGGGGGGRGGCETSAVFGGNGGAGGGDNGANGTDAPTPGGVAGGGGPGAGVSGGAAGIGCGGFLGAPGANGSGANGGNGGAGQGCCCFGAPSVPGGGGGGGGMLGGGGGGGGSAGTTGCSGNDKGAGGGGAGGTSAAILGSNVTITNGVQAGNGQVIIRY